MLVCVYVWARALLGHHASALIAHRRLSVAHSPEDPCLGRACHHNKPGKHICRLRRSGGFGSISSLPISIEKFTRVLPPMAHTRKPREVDARIMKEEAREQYATRTKKGCDLTLIQECSIVGPEHDPSPHAHGRTGFAQPSLFASTDAPVSHP